MIDGSFDAEMDELPDPEFTPPQHPNLVFRACISGDLRRIMYLGGDEYWIHGVWMVTDGSRMLMVRNRIFRVSELRFALISMPFDFDIEGRPPALN